MRMKKTVLITGAGTGIGKDTAYALTKRGHRVIATTETIEQKEKLMLESQDWGKNIEIFKLDITISEDRLIIEKYDVDVLINNAGIGESGSLAEIDFNKVRHNFEINVFCAFELSQLALKKMFANNSGTVIFISSLVGRIAAPFLGPYSMTKFALSSGAEAMRNEIHRVRKNVHVSLIEPGGYHTGFNQKNIAKKYKWMDENSIFYSMIDQIKKEEVRQFKMVEAKSTNSIVKLIVRATEVKRPRLRYSAPRWQAIGIQILRIFGK